MILEYHLFDWAGIALSLFVSSGAGWAILRLLVRRRSKQLDVRRKRVLLAYVVALLVYSALYLPLAFGYLALAGLL